MFVLKLITCGCLFVSINCDCGHPPLPVGILRNEMQITYPEGHELLFVCESPYEVVTWNRPKGHFLPFYADKSVKIICNSGKWIGQVPRCAEAIPLINSQKIVSHIDFYRGNITVTDLEAGRVGDRFDQFEVNSLLLGWSSRFHKNLSCCVYDISSFVTTNHTWVLYLRRNQSIAFITIELQNQLETNLLDYENPPVTAYVSDYRRCALHYIENTVGALIQILCEVYSQRDYEYEKDAKLDKFILNFNGNISATKFNVVSLCIYTFPTSCGTPEIPLNTRASVEPQSVQFHCISKRHSYTSRDVRETRCNADAKWSNTVDSCKPTVTCALDPFDKRKYKQLYKVQNKLVVDNVTDEAFVYENAEFVDGDLVAVIGTVESHRCQGIKEATTRICGDDGKWIGVHSTCAVLAATKIRKKNDLMGYVEAIVILSVSLLMACIIIVILIICVIWDRCKR